MRLDDAWRARLVTAIDQHIDRLSGSPGKRTESSRHGRCDTCEMVPPGGGIRRCRRPRRPSRRRLSSLRCRLLRHGLSPRHRGATAQRFPDVQRLCARSKALAGLEAPGRIAPDALELLVVGDGARRPDDPAHRHVVGSMSSVQPARYRKSPSRRGSELPGLSIAFCSSGSK